ncbi:hypothetical protein FA15DRAFT_371950 [Coprinopsis marcescibilis]|uniref:Uncharacterized protein n=1 Tax=Coprinopsis marcescibilis TaxID=230819 RepID=A0A5C3KAG8_COPMA|nr:hypothetical protein FA15DRAFT_371950 [Coprinopsis marcescibilis]
MYAHKTLTCPGMRQAMDVDFGPATSANAVVAGQKEEEREAEMLSTFRPVEGENVFGISAGEAAALGLPEVSATTLVLLPAHETLCLLGTFGVGVVHGCVDLFGVRVGVEGRGGGGMRVHRVFAPSSAPLPVLKAAFAIKCSRGGGHVLEDSVFRALPLSVQSVVQRPVLDSGCCDRGADVADGRGEVGGCVPAV